MTDTTDRTDRIKLTFTLEELELIEEGIYKLIDDAEELLGKIIEAEEELENKEIEGEETE